MMWNFLLSGLTVGCTLVLYDGSPLYDPAYLWRLVDDLGITIFGTSAKYIDHLAVCLVWLSHALMGIPQTLRRLLASFSSLTSLADRARSAESS